MGEQIIEIYKKKIRKEWKIAFWCTTVFGILVHLYKFANMLPNHDSLYNYYSSQNMVGSGRWFLTIACGFTSYFDLPWVIGIVSVVILAVTAVIIVELFEVENPVLIVLIAGLLVTFPSVTETFFFEFTADGYLLAMLFATLSVRFATFYDKKKMHIAISLVLLCLSCGIYQAYVSFAAVLTLCHFIFILLRVECTLKECISWIARQIIVYAGGLTLYYAVWRICMLAQGVSVGDYQGMNEMGVSLSTILGAIPKTIRTLVLFLVEWNVIEHGWTLYGILNVLFIACAVIVLGVSVRKSVLLQKSQKLILILLCFIAIPFAACIWFFATPGVEYRTMMLGSLVVLYILVAILADTYLNPKFSNVIGGLLIIIIVNNGLIANISYSFMNKSYEASYAVGAEMLFRIHELDTDSTEVMIIGDLAEEVSLSHSEEAMKVPKHAQMIEKHMLYNQEHLILFLNNVFECNFSNVDDECAERLMQSEDVAKMENWPAKNSVRNVDDVIVIKLSDDEEVKNE